jgi:hypothetical protein
MLGKTLIPISIDRDLSGQAASALVRAAMRAARCAAAASSTARSASARLMARCPIRFASALTATCSRQRTLEHHHSSCLVREQVHSHHAEQRLYSMLPAPQA